MKAGIYRFVNTVTGDCYIGSSSDLNRRRLQHLNSLRKNKHHSYRFQKAWNDYGETQFDYEILEELEITEDLKDQLFDREQYWINIIEPEYNILPAAGSTLGYHHTEETKQKISNSTKGVKKSAEHAKHIKEGQQGRVLTQEHKEKLSQSAKNRKSMSHHSIISIDGIIYNSLKEASERTGVKYNTIQKRLKNPNFGNYFYVKYPNKINNETIKIEEHD